MIERILKDLGNGFLSIDKGFSFGPQGRLLRRNIEDLWYKYAVIMPPYNVFLSSSDKLTETLENLQTVGAIERPLGIAAIEASKVSWNVDLIPENCKINSHKIGIVTMITDAIGGKDLYHKKQRERKVWWRKFSREPSRFKFTEAKKISKNKDSIEIEAQFDFGSVVVETITYQQDVRKLFREPNENEITSAEIHIVEHTASLDWGCLAFLCDSYTNCINSGQLKLHPKFSPYKVGFHILSSTDVDGKIQEKSKLLMYLNNSLKAKGIETIVTTNWKGMEILQVPLIVTVDDTSLHTGIIRVWSKLTTLSESVHITELTRYIIMRCS